MGTRKQRQRQEELWYRRDLAEAPGHPFYQRLNEVLGMSQYSAKLNSYDTDCFGDHVPVALSPGTTVPGFPMAPPFDFPQSL